MPAARKKTTRRKSGSAKKAPKKKVQKKPAPKKAAQKKRTVQAKKPRKKTELRESRVAIAGRVSTSKPSTPRLSSYRNGKSWWLYADDCLNILEKLPEESVDMVFADPPYGLSNGGISVHAGKRVSVNKGDWDKTRGTKGDYEFHRDWIKACRKVLKPNGTLWVSGSMHSIYLCGTALQLGGWRILNEIAWYKPNAAPHLAGRMFAHSHETLIWARKTDKARHYFDYERMKKAPCPQDFIKKADRQMRSVWAINSPAPHEKRYGKHPTQKPEMLLQRIVLACSKRGQLVLDPFCGSATTGVAAVRAGRKFIGIDNEKSYLDKHAIPRLKDEESKIK